MSDVNPDQNKRATEMSKENPRIYVTVITPILNY